VRTLLLCLALSATAFAQVGVQRRLEPPATEKKAEKPTKEELKLAADLIQRAQTLAADLNDTDKAYVLAKMAELSSKRNPEQSQNWAEEAFNLANNLTDVSKGSVQMSAIMAMSQNNLDRALGMFSSMDGPRQRDDGTQTPDIRGAAATMLFTRAFTKDGMKSIDALESAARQMGENGFYPYMAMAQLMRQVAEKDKDRAQSIATTALGYANRRKLSGMESQQLTMFLMQAREYVPVPMMKQILEQVIADALEQAKQSDGTQVSAEFSNAAGERVQLTSMASLMMFQLMPMIRQVDPEWAKKLEEQSDELRKAAAMMRTGNTSIMIGARNGGPNGPNDNNRDFRQEIQSMQVDELASRDPKRAMEMANNINDPAMHAAAVARVSSAGTDADAQQKALDNAREVLKSTSEPREKLSILAGIVQLEASMKDEDGLGASLQQAFGIADDMFRRSIDKNPSTGAWMRPGAEVGASIVRRSARKYPAIVADKIDSVRQSALKALMLLAAAESLDPESRTQSGPVFQFRFAGN
jgi:hypothetical protein